MTVIRRRKKPVEVDTIQWTGDNEAEVQAFTGGASTFYALDAEGREGSDDPEATATVYDKLHSTWVLVYTGQHVVRGVKGEFYPIAEDVLAETYEPAAPAVSSPPPDQTLRDRIASALYEARRPGLGGMSESAAVTYMANAVVRVLPPPADQAAVLLEAAKSLERAFGVTQVTVELRLMSAKAQQPDTETVPCVRSDAHPPHLHSGLRKGVAVHGRCPGAPAVPVQPAADGEEAPPVCEGFVWIGQSFAICERCGQPAWEHEGEEVPVEGAGPFDNQRTVRPWAPGQADRIRAKWGAPATEEPQS